MVELAVSKMRDPGATPGGQVMKGNRLLAVLCSGPMSIFRNRPIAKEIKCPVCMYKYACMHLYILYTCMYMILLRNGPHNW